MTLTLAAVKAHCRVDFSDDDDILSRYLAAASDHLSAIGVDMTADPLPASIEVAALLLVKHYFENGDAVAPDAGTATAFGVDRLTAPYRVSVS